jgi:hypothetical protein
MAAGALLVLVVGYLGYRAYIGPFPLKLMFQATIDFLRSASQYTAQYQIAPSIFLRTQPHIYAPVLVCVGTVMVLGRSLLSNTLRARMAQFAVAYTLVFWVYRFATRTDVLEVYFYYEMTAVTGAFAMPAILDEIGRRHARANWFAVAVAGVAVAATGVIDLVISSTPSALNMFQYVRTHTVVLVLILVACSIAAALLTVLKHYVGRLIAAAVFCAIVATIALTPATSTENIGNFSVYGTTAELEAYHAGYDMTQLIAKYDHPSSRVLLWDDLQGLGNAGWVNLLGHLGTYTIPPLPVLTQPELAVLRAPTTTRVLAVSQSASEVARAVPALAKRGLGPSLENEGVWTGGHLYYALIKLHASHA